VGGSDELSNTIQQEELVTSTAHSTHLPALREPHQREEVGQQLQATLVELIDLSLLGKQLHWSVVGPLFRPLHQQLERADRLVARAGRHCC
jgi:DNA-binding ferritin-like protein